MCVAALVLGIVSVVFGLFINGWIGLVIGIVGIILAVLGGKANPAQKGMATAGLVLSIIGVILGLILGIFCGCVMCAACSTAASLS